MSALTVVVLAHVSMVELMSVVRLCWMSWILCRRLRRGGGVAGWEDGWEDGRIGGGWEVGEDGEHAEGGRMGGWEGVRMVVVFVSRTDVCVDGYRTDMCIDVG